jgi:hypothetical protein
MKSKSYYKNLVKLRAWLGASKGDVPMGQLFPNAGLPTMGIDEFSGRRERARKLFRLSEGNYSKLFESNLRSADELIKRIDSFIS